MSWNNVIPWKMLECMTTCKDIDPATGYTVHIPECKLGQEVEKRQKDNNERDQDPSSTCPRP